ncbi:MAG TPA: cytochrome c biogenesis protein CcsA [Terriglobales bacterium]|jgi:heme exporter protein C
MKRLLPIFGAITTALLGFALYEALIGAPTEQTMGNVQRIFYYHVSSAWTAFILFFLNFVASVLYLVRKNDSQGLKDRLANWVVIALGIITCIAAYLIKLPDGIERSSVASTGIAAVCIYFLVRKYFPEDRGDALAVTTAEVGVVFCTVVLVTGPLWARPVWGIWWAPGDVRLTSTLVLWLIYVSYLILRRFSSSGQTPKIAAVLAVFGALDVPLVYFSIWFFRTQHPQPVIGDGGSIDPRMLHVLLLNWLAFSCFAALLCWARYRLEVLRREVDETLALESLLEPRGSR